jgi:PAS domain S-box-containing protein
MVEKSENEIGSGSKDVSHLVDGKYAITDLVDIDKLRALLEEFSDATGFTTGFVSYPGLEVLIATGWRDICTKFHRSCDASMKHCKTSNKYLLEQLRNLKELNVSPCENGLVDGATPVIIKGVHIASLATGQIFFEQPDIERFKKQAETYNYDIDKYLDAVKQVPVVTEEQFKKALSFLSGIASMIAEQGLNNLRIIENTKKLEREIKERQIAETALSESEKVYRLLAENVSDTIWVLDMDLNFIYISPSVAAMRGYTAEEAINQTLEEILVGESLQNALNLFAREKDNIENGDVQPQTIELEFYCKDGSTVITESKISLIYDDEGNPKNILGATRDISKRKKVEDRFRLAAETVSDLIYEWDISDDSLQWFGDIDKRLGYEPGGLPRTIEAWVRHIHPEDLERLADAVKLHRTSTKPIMYEYRVKRNDGSWMFWSDHAKPILGSDGLPKVWIGVCTDITEKKRAEEQRRSYLGFLESLERINNTIRQAKNLKEMLKDVIDTVYSIFDCDRAWLLYPCDPKATSFRVPMETAHPDYPGALDHELDIPMTPDMAAYCRDALNSAEPITYLSGSENPVSGEMNQFFGVQSLMLMSIHPKIGQPWVFGLHQCSSARVWTNEEKELFNEIARRIADGLSNYIFLRNLRESEERYRALVEDMPSLICRFLVGGVLTFVNNSYCRYFGKSVEELVGKSFFELMPDEDHQKVKNYIESLSTENSTSTYEHRVISANGEIRWQQRTDRAIFKNGNLVEYQSISHDITDRKRAEEESSRLLAIIEATSDLVSTAKPDSRLFFMNRAGREMLEWGAEEEINNYRISDIHPKEALEKIEQIGIPKALQGGIWSGETAVINRQGVEIPVSQVIMAHHTPDGKFEYLSTIIRDITDRKQAEEELREAYRELRELDDIKNNFFANISHEFRTPMVSIKGYTELLQRIETLPPYSAEWLERILGSSERLERLVDDLLAISSLQAGKTKLNCESFDMRDLIRFCLKMLKPKIEDKNLTVTETYSDNLPQISADRQKIISVILNLLENAIKFSEEDGELILCLEKKNSSKLHFSIKDKGLGIPEKYFNKVFSKFFQVDSSSTRKYGGSGIGLSLVKEIVAAHDGRVWLDSTEGKGSTFFFELPFSREMPVSENRKDAEEISLKEPRATEGNLTVLLIEDDQDVIELVKTFGDNENCEILFAITGKSGIDILRKRRIDLVFLDIGMPDINGIDICRQIRNDESLKKTPVYMLTAYTGDNFMKASSEAGADGFIKKPFSLDTIWEVIEKVGGN